VLTLALGLGANVAIFSFLDGVLLKRMPYPEPERIVQIWEKPPQYERNGVSALNYLDWKDQATAFEFMAARSGDSVTLTGHGEPIQLRATRVTAQYFDVLGVKAATGRTFAADEDQPGRDRVAVISHRLWQTTFGGRPDVLTRSIVLNGDTHSIIGVMPEGSEFDRAFAEIWLPLALRREAVVRNFHYLNVMARLKPGMTVERAQTEMSAIAGRIAELYPDIKKGWSARVDRLIDRIVGNNLRTSLYVLMAAVGAVLPIGGRNEVEPESGAEDLYRPATGIDERARRADRRGLTRAMTDRIELHGARTAVEAEAVQEAVLRAEIDADQCIARVQTGDRNGRAGGSRVGNIDREERIVAAQQIRARAGSRGARAGHDRHHQQNNGSKHLLDECAGQSRIAQSRQVARSKPSRQAVCDSSLPGHRAERCGAASGRGVGRLIRSRQRGEHRVADPFDRLRAERDRRAVAGHAVQRTRGRRDRKQRLQAFRSGRCRHREGERRARLHDASERRAVTPVKPAQHLARWHVGLTHRGAQNVNI
jgi:hypothetical protein